MPRGHKMTQGYATVKDGMDYRAISNVMTSNGYKMNHATARNVLLSAMRTIAHEVLLSTGEEVSLEKADSVARSPNFQSGVADMMSDLDSEGVIIK